MQRDETRTIVKHWVRNTSLKINYKPWRPMQRPWMGGKLLCSWIRSTSGSTFLESICPCCLQKDNWCFKNFRAIRRTQETSPHGQAQCHQGLKYTSQHICSQKVPLVSSNWFIIWPVLDTFSCLFPIAIPCLCSFSTAKCFADASSYPPTLLIPKSINRWSWICLRWGDKIPRMVGQVSGRM